MHVMCFVGWQRNNWIVLENGSFRGTSTAASFDDAMGWFLAFLLRSLHIAEPNFRLHWTRFHLIGAGLHGFVVRIKFVVQAVFFFDDCVIFIGLCLFWRDKHECACRDFGWALRKNPKKIISIDSYRSLITSELHSCLGFHCSHKWLELWTPFGWMFVLQVTFHAPTADGGNLHRGRAQATHSSELTNLFEVIFDEWLFEIWRWNSCIVILFRFIDDNPVSGSSHIQTHWIQIPVIRIRNWECKQS